MSEVRKSNYELLRIVSMFLIVLYHVIVHGHVLLNSQNGGFSIVIFFIKLFTLVHVNSFILMTGYFQCDKKFKMSKVWKLINMGLFYRIIIIVLFSFLGLITVSKLDILKQSSIFCIGQYWFVRIYIVLYCLAPFLNILISKLSKSDYLKMLGVLFIIFSLLPFITGNQAFENTGYTLYQMVLMYLIGGYLKHYPLDKSYLFKRYSKSLYQLILITIIFISILMNGAGFIMSYSFKNVNSITGFIFNNLHESLTQYSNPFIIIQSIAFFCLFCTFNVQNKLVNKLSSLTLGIYMIHDNTYVRSNIYKWLKIDAGPITSYKFIIYIFVVTIFIFITCAIIEWIRQIIFKFIYNRKISTKLRDKFNNWIRSIKILNLD